MTLGRDNVVEYLESTLIGPVDGTTEQVPGMPNKRYLMGILFPPETSTHEALNEEHPDAIGVAEGELTGDDPVALSGQWLPSSIGISVFVEAGASLLVRVWGAGYARLEGNKRVYVREPLAERDHPEEQPLSSDVTSLAVLQGRADLRVRRRPLGAGELVTVAMVNPRQRADEDDPEPEECLYQTGFELSVGGERILEYPSVQLLSRDLDEQELRLTHRHSKTFAVGHGCAVEWNGESETRKRSVKTVLMPRHDVLGVTQAAPEGLAQDVLDVARLGSSKTDWGSLRGELEAFVGVYEAWGQLQATRTDVPTVLDTARRRIVDRITLAAERMRAGIRLLDADADVRNAFRLANTAMAIQRMRQAKDRGGTRREVGSELDLRDDATDDGFRWYPFQLAFQLLVLPSLVSGDDPHRRDVDLIWFPTGGGKTEAYLAVAATEIFLRRIRHGDRGGGTAVLTRYTLRLLTAQQFQRAAATICACEVLRTRDVGLLGSEPITIGLWVGDAAVPNSCTGASERFSEVRGDDEPTNPFQLEVCPWCGTEIMPRVHSDDDEAYGIRAGLDDFRFNCPAEACPFHNELPVQVVDDALYKRPPTLLLGTVDKFARLAWAATGLAFFGAGGRFRPPSMIIQDELHLLSGPLGTTVGVYEAAIDALCSVEGEPPKIVASTATIRRSDDQVRGLFGGREVRLFPPSGVDAEDSFFARQDRSRPGRLYVGVMAQSHTLQTAMIHLGAALLEGVHEVDLTDAERDAYWTMVAYHNSLRELGRTVTLARDDIPARLEGIAGAESSSRRVDDEDVVELTSNVGGTNLTSVLARMARGLDTDDVISVLACTNMLSVGVDVPRLGLMVVNGQPKTTAEYIQATSRVGRGAVPGLVCALYTATKPRDRSHYETFGAYHASLYRHVEPTSVTPWSPASRDRALHAAFVILVRSLCGLASNSDAHRFDAAAPEVAAAKDLIMKAVVASDDEEVEVTSAFIDRKAEEWSELIADAEADGKTLYFSGGGKNVKTLLKRFGGFGKGWATLDSMRNVDRQSLVRVQGEDS